VERLVLNGLCLPILSGSPFTPPDDETDRRTRLANEAVQRGVIGPEDLRDA
jgi:hypothetical protein